MPGQDNYEYYVDIVMCIDGTGSMKPIIAEVKEKALSFYKMFIDQMEESDREVSQLRIKVIVFRDYGEDAVPMQESPFFTLPADNDAFNSFVHGIEAKGGGDAEENALEAIALALKSDWTTGGDKRRHCILVFSDAPALDLGVRAGKGGYPSGMPRDLPQLGAWWHGTDQSLAGTYEPRAGRLVAFVPKLAPWTSLQSWQRYFPAYSQAGKGLKGLEIQNAIDVLVGSLVEVEQ